MDQGGEAGCENDAAELPPVSVERGPALAEPDRLQPGSLWRRLVLPKEDRRLVADQLAATAGEDRRQTDQARPVLLAESHLRRRLFGAMLGRIESLPLPAG